MSGTDVTLGGKADPRSGGVSEAKGRRAPSKKPFIIGVTGGMASGKSTVARMFAGRGILHVDADKIVHDVMQHDRATIAEIAQHFPGAFVPPPGGGRLGGGHGETPSSNSPPPQPSPYGGGSIDRAALAAAVSKQPELLTTLEHILHPRVRAREEEAILLAQRNRLRAVILDIPLLFETDADQLCDVVVVVHAPMKLRRQRAFRRLGMTELKWQRLLARQLKDHERHARADVVIPTSIGKAATRRAVQKLKMDWGLK